MKGKNRLAWLEAFLLAFSISFSAMACVVTAFDFPNISLWLLCGCCALAALCCGLCCGNALVLIPLGLFAAAAGYLWQAGILEPSFEALLYKISRVYHDAYNWQIIRWSWRNVQDMNRNLPPIIYLLGALLAAIAAWTVRKAQSSIVACLLPVLLLCTCFVVTDTVPDTLWLICFFTCMAVLMFTSHTRQEDPLQGRKLTAFLALPVLAAVCVLFFAVPSQAYYRQPQAQAIRNLFLGKTTLEQMVAALTGQEDDTDQRYADLTQVGPRQDRQTQVLEVTTRYGDTFYLRNSSLDRYTGTAWEESGTPLPDLYWPNSEEFRSIGEVQIKTRYAHELLYLPYYAQSMDLTKMTRGMENSKKLNEYSFPCAIPDGSVYRYVQQRPVSAAAQVQIVSLLRLPEDVRQWAVPLAQRIAGDQKDPYYQALLIAEYVKNSARYDQNTSRMPSDAQDFVKWFLEESDTGYCIHFASAGAVLLKALGIPARYTTGYMVHTRAGTPTQVLAADAHAWVEYWLPGFGWTVLECTPADTQTGAAPTQTEEQRPTQTEPESPSAPQATQESNPGQAAPKPAKKQAKWLLVPALALILTALFLYQRRLRLRLRRKARHTGSMNAQVLAHWQEALRLSRHLGIHPGEDLLFLAEKAKFSPYTMTRAELTQMDMFLDTARQKLRRKKPLQRFWDKWILALY